MEIVARFFSPPKQSYFLLGPRGTGKSTWAAWAYPEALRIDLLDLDVVRRLEARPERLRELVLGRDDVSVVVVDEVQRVPELLSVVHAMIESQPSIQWVLTGSSARKIRRAGVDLMAGRALHRTMHPFMAAELGTQFDLDEALRWGLVPLVVRSPDPLDVLRSYIALYVREEVQIEGLVRNIGAFSRFLEAISFSHGGVLNLSNVARDAEVGRKTVESYVEILEDLLIAHRLPVFSRRAKRAVTRRPKFYFFDVGVYRGLRPSGPLDRPDEIHGPALEGLVLQHLRAWLSYRNSSARIYYWRTRGGSEVDFVVYGAEEFWAVEVKNTTRVARSDLRSLRSFGDDFPECRRLLIYRGEERLQIDDVTCIPCDEFLRSLHPRTNLLGRAEPVPQGPQGPRDRSAG